MKTKETGLNDLLHAFSHPSTALYRAIELKQIYEGCKDLNLQGSSLDIGSGDGLISNLLFNKKFSYGVDNGEAHDYQIAVDKKRYGKVLLESAEKMSLPDRSINFAFSNSVLEHIPGINNVFRETSRVLKSGGYFIFTTPSKYFKKGINISPLLNKIGLGWINNKYSLLRNNALNHYNLHDHYYYAKKLQKYGFKIIDYSYAIDEHTLKLWDKMAIRIKLKSIFGLNTEEKIKKIYLSEIIRHYQKPSINKSHGMNLLIVAKKTNG